MNYLLESSHFVLLSGYFLLSSNLGSPIATGVIKDSQISSSEAHSGEFDLALTEVVAREVGSSKIVTLPLIAISALHVTDEDIRRDTLRISIERSTVRVTIEVLDAKDDPVPHAQLSLALPGRSFLLPVDDEGRCIILYPRVQGYLTVNGQERSLTVLRGDLAESELTVTVGLN